MSGTPATTQYDSGLPSPTQSIPIDPQTRAFLSGVASVHYGNGGNSASDDAAPQPNAAPAAGGNVKDTVAQQWASAGYPPAAVSGIMRRIGDESGWNPHAIGDDGTSFGLYQHHGPRAVKLNDWAQANGLNPADPTVQTRFAIYEMSGGDPQATRAAQQLKDPTNPADAYGTSTRGFERPEGAPGSEDTNLHRAAHGGFYSGAQNIVADWQKTLDDARERYSADIAGAKDLESAEVAATNRWMAMSEQPPQNMHQARQQWNPIAVGLALLGGLRGGAAMTASLVAGGSMMISAQQADRAAYDQAYDHWKTNLDIGTKLIGMLHDQAAEIMGQAGKAYDQKLAELKTLGAAYKVQAELNPDSLDNQAKLLRMQYQYQRLIEAQNGGRGHWQVLTDPRTNIQYRYNSDTGQATALDDPTKPYKPSGAQHLSAKPTTPAAVDQKSVEAEASMIAGYHMPPLSAWVLRSPWGQAVMAKVQQLNPDYDAAKYAGRVSGTRAFASGRQSDAVRSLSVSVDHLAVAQQLGQALQTGDLQSLNRAQAALHTEFGFAGPVNFDTAKQIVADEVQKAVLGGAGSLSDREALQQQFSTASSPDQLLGVIGTLKRLMAGQLAGYRRQYRAATGDADFDQLLSPQARQELGSLTPSAAAPAMRYTAKNAAGVTIHSPDGQHWFNSDGSIYAK
jgi:Phage tail lysozyme